jgi:hypothetical protein
MSCPILMRLLLLFHLRPQLATPLQKAQCNWHLVGRGWKHTNTKRRDITSTANVIAARQTANYVVLGNRSTNYLTIHFYVFHKEMLCIFLCKRPHWT